MFAPAGAGAVKIKISQRDATLALMLAVDLLLAATALFPVLHSSTAAWSSVLGAALLLAAAQAAIVFGGLLPRKAVEPVVRRQHVLPAFAQLLLVLYWGLWWTEVYRHLPLLLAQLLFAYGLDMVLAWSRRRAWQLGFGPVPITLSLNFYIWFKPEYFCLQLGMVALAYLVKTFVTREVDGQRRHIFNPSGVPLAALALYLLATNAYQQTYGTDFIASFYIPPNMIESVFLLALLSNAAFRTTLVTAGAGLTMLALNASIIAVAGAPLLSRPFDPLVLIGAGLLVTDPSTSPRNGWGKLLFGALYGATTYVFVAILHLTSHPGYFDKVLAVPVANAAAPFLDSLGARLGAWSTARLKRWRDLRPWLPTLASNKLHLAVWSACFVWAVPSLKIDRRPTLVAIPEEPESVMTVEMVRENMAVANRCQRYPRMCAPFGFLAELDYWIRDGR